MISEQSQQFLPATEEPARKASEGEKWFDWTIYKGLNYWVNLGSSLIIADYFINLGGKGQLAAAAKLMSGGSQGGLRYATVGLEQLALNSGGWLLCVPIKIAEDNKRPIVHWLNDKLGVDQRAPDGHKMTADEIFIEKEQPKQSWLKMFCRRAVASGSTIVFGMGLDKAYATDKPMMINGELKSQVGGKDRLTQNFVDASNWALRKLPGGEALAAQNWMKRYLSLAALDIINTKITSSVMYMTNGAKKAQAPHEIPAPADTPHEPHKHDYPAPEQEAVQLAERKPVASDALRSRKAGESFAEAHARKTETSPDMQLGA